MSSYVKNIIRFCVFVIMQVLLLKHVTISIGGLPIYTPYIYPLFILLLPFNTPIALLMILGFCMGITVDAANNTAGMHAFATVLIAYYRINVLNALLPKNIHEYYRQTPSVKNLGWLQFIVYVSFLIVLHHAAYYAIELWSSANLAYLLLKILISSVTSILFALAYALLFTNQGSLANR